MLKEILSITGKPGLSKLITGGKKMIVVESLLDAKRFPIHSHEKVVSLADIAIYTETAEVPLREVLQKMQEKEGGKVSINPKTTSNEDIKKYFAEKVFNTYIRDNIALAEAPAQRKDIFSYSPKSPGAEDYLNLAKEILTRI